MRALFLMTFSLISGLILSGCCSTRFTTTMNKTEASRMQGKACFKIVKATPPPVHFMCGSPTGYALETPNEVRKSNLSFGKYNIPENVFRDKIQDTAFRRYPELFKDAPDAIPIEVSVSGRNSSSTAASLTAELLTLAILGGILPLPISGSSDFSVSTELHETATPGAHEPITFTRKDVAWMTVFTPLGLIPIPGDSACEKSCEIGQLRSFRRGGELTLEGFVDAVVKSLDTLDLSKLDSRRFVLENGRDTPRTAAATVPEAEESVADRLKRLKELKDKGFLSEHEYQLKRESLVKQL